MQKSKIEWTDMTWNPIKGLCPVGCWYCYARKMYNSKFYSKPPFDNPIVRFGYENLANFKKIPDGSKIFICSTFEIFHPVITKDNRDYIFRIIEDNPQHTFQVLTKMPENIDREMPDNVWLGVSITMNNDANYQRILDLSTKKAKVRFVSFEPLLGHINTLYIPALIDWVIVGRLSQHGKKDDPPYDWAYGIINTAKKRGIPIFLKNNLKDIWGEDLIQEFPK